MCRLSIAAGNGVLSRTEATDLLMELQAASGSAPSASVSAEEVADVLDLVDADGNGSISFVEFLVAFGLNDDADTAPAPSAELDRYSHTQNATSAFALTPQSGKSAAGCDRVPSGHHVDLVTQIAQNVCAAIYERLHALQRAFSYLDVDGHGWINAKDFEHAIALVLDRVPPHGMDLLQNNATESKTSKEDDEDTHVVSGTDIATLVGSLAESSLADGKSPPSIDYCGFVQAFVVRDIEGNLV